MSKTNFNKNNANLLNQLTPVDVSEIERITSRIGKYPNVYHAIIDDKWLEEQYEGDGEEIKDKKLGPVILSIEILILDIINDKALVQNKHTYKEKYGDDFYERSIYYYGPIERSLLDDILANNTK